MGNNVAISQGDLDDWTHPSNTWQFVARQLIARISTMKLVQVKAVKGGGAGALAAAGTVDVLPLVNQIDGNGNMTVHGTVFGIPWWRLQGGTGAVICDPKVGDIGMVLCADRDSSSVIRTKAQANPGSRRKYDLADGIYVGSILGLTPTQYLQFVEGGGINLVDSFGNKVQMMNGGLVLVPASGQPITLEGPTNIQGGPLHVIAANATVDGILAVGGNATVGGTLGVTGDLTGSTAHFSGAVQLAGGAQVTRFFTGSYSVSGTIGGPGGVGIFTVTAAGLHAGDAVILIPGGNTPPGTIAAVTTVGTGAFVITLANASATGPCVSSGSYLVIGTT